MDHPKKIKIEPGLDLINEAIDLKDRSIKFESNSFPRNKLDLLPHKVLPNKIGKGFNGYNKYPHSGKNIGMD